MQLNHTEVKKILLGDRNAYEIIPFGLNCTPAHYLRGMGLRVTALPFDWNVTPVQSAIQLMENGFTDFMEAENLIFLPPVDRLLFDELGVQLEIKNDIITPVVCKKYNILFPHDFPKDYQGCLATVQAKYQRRIERFMELLNSNVHLIFVHHNDELNDWQKHQYSMALEMEFANPCQGWGAIFSSVVEAKYPKLSYSLMDIGDLHSVTGKAF